MNESLEEIAVLYVLDQLGPRERAAVEARLTDEPALAALVRDYEAALEAGVHSLPPRPPPASLLQRLEREIDVETRPERKHVSRLSSPAARPPRLPWVTLARWGLAAVVTVSLATLAIQSLRPRTPQPVFVVVGLDANRTTFAELPSPEAKDPDARFIQLAATAEDLWRNPAARPLPAAAADNRGYALFDPASQQGFIAIEQLPALPGNQQYHLWVVDGKSGRIRDAGILPLAGLNRGLYSFALDPADAPPHEPARPNFFITVEDATPTSQPRGKVVLGKETI
jgi:hypothetical protein